jgi:hypothetical protein
VYTSNLAQTSLICWVHSSAQNPRNNSSNLSFQDTIPVSSIKRVAPRSGLCTQSVLLMFCGVAMPSEAPQSPHRPYLGRFMIALTLVTNSSNCVQPVSMPKPLLTLDMIRYIHGSVSSRSKFVILMLMI